MDSTNEIPTLKKNERSELTYKIYISETYINKVGWYSRAIIKSSRCMYQAEGVFTVVSSGSGGFLG